MCLCFAWVDFRWWSSRVSVLCKFNLFLQVLTNFGHWLNESCYMFFYWILLEDSSMVDFYSRNLKGSFTKGRVLCWLVIRLMNEDCYSENVVIHLGNGVLFQYDEASSLLWSWLFEKEAQFAAWKWFYLSWVLKSV